MIFDFLNVIGNISVSVTLWWFLCDDRVDYSDCYNPIRHHGISSCMLRVVIMWSMCNLFHFFLSSKLCACLAACILYNTLKSTTVCTYHFVIRDERGCESATINNPFSSNCSNWKYGETFCKYNKNTSNFISHCTGSVYNHKDVRTIMKQFHINQSISNVKFNEIILYIINESVSFKHACVTMN